MAIRADLFTARVADAGTGLSGPCLFVWVEDRLLPARVADREALSVRQHDIALCSLDTDGGVVVERVERSGNRFTEDILRWRRPDASEMSRMAYLRKRDTIRRAIEDYFFEHGFVHIPSPVHVRNPNPEPQFDIITTNSGCLITSPELQLKRMLIGGFERIYSLVSCFRGKEVDRTHNPEFTMLEWYRVGAGLKELRADLEELITLAARVCGNMNAQGKLKNSAVTLRGLEWEVKSVRELVYRYCSMDLSGCTEAEDLYSRGAVLGFFGREHSGERFEQLFCRLWSRFEAQLGKERPLFITEWPLPLASLAAPSVTDPAVCDRMELVIDGMELANGFRELTDPAEQRSRMQRDCAERKKQNLPIFEPDPGFLTGMEAGLPACAGMALGFDRLCMLLLNAPGVASVLPFSTDEL